MLQRLTLGDSSVEQRGQRQQLCQRFALALLLIQFQQGGGTLVDVLQVASVVPGHNAVIHAVEQAVKLVQVAVGLGKEAIGIQRITDFACQCQRQGQIAGGAVGQQTAQRN